VTPFRATYRLQLHAGFDLDAARELVPYLSRLGVSHLYASPITTAVPGSAHGYDVMDPTAVNPELGGRAALDALVETLRAHSMGLVIDIVPNHMATRGPWWDDTLRNGRTAPSAPVFDIDWDRGGGRVILPVLGAPVPQLVARGDLVVEAEGAEGPALVLDDRRFPLAPESDLTASIPELLHQQHYELVEWDRARGRRNYRRFFDIDDLVGVRVEDPAVFARTHSLILELVDAGLVDGLRVDHVDGLRDPRAYLERLRAAIGLDRLLVVEKILGADEELPDVWPVDGTTGYEDLAALDALFVHPVGLDRLVEIWASEHGLRFSDIEGAGKALMLGSTFAGELDALQRSPPHHGQRGRADARDPRPAGLPDLRRRARRHPGRRNPHRRRGRTVAGARRGPDPDRARRRPRAGARLAAAHRSRQPRRAGRTPRSTGTRRCSSALRGRRLGGRPARSRGRPRSMPATRPAGNGGRAASPRRAPTTPSAARTPGPASTRCPS